MFPASPPSLQPISMSLQGPPRRSLHSSRDPQVNRYKGRKAQRMLYTAIPHRYGEHSRDPHPHKWLTCDQRNLLAPTFFYHRNSLHTGHRASSLPSPALSEPGTSKALWDIATLALSNKVLDSGTCARKKVWGHRHRYGYGIDVKLDIAAALSELTAGGCTLSI